MKIECTRGFGLVEHPDTGEEINVVDPFETDRETYEALTDAYPGFRVIEDGDSGRDSGGKDGENTDTEPTCGVNGCGRTVDTPEDTCWQHPAEERTENS